MTTDETQELEPRDTVVTGRIKWFDSAKGYGFLTDDGTGQDVLLHGNVLRKFGQSTVVEGAPIVVLAVETPRGRQAAAVLSIESTAQEYAPIADLAAGHLPPLPSLPLRPARVKWFDKAKGFGFASLFGHRGDVFLHLEVVRHSGFGDLFPGEAVALRVVDGPRGMMAAQVASWDFAAAPEPEVQA
ncbi:MAG: cold-shock protein [Paracoccus denitrificans]|nr:MAG: cold-shock protein [Paracoccus denitrificans]PZO86053.1 MAG: cold-shock protein [Paracoccus denitrificans]